MREDEGEVSSIKPVSGLGKEEKRTMVKVLVIEIDDKVKELKTEEARKKSSILGQSISVADQELGKTKLSQNNSSLVDILTNLLNDENSVIILTPRSHISTTGLIYTHGNCTTCSEIKTKVPGQDVPDKDIDSNCTSCTSTITEGSEEIVQEPVTSQRLKGYFCADTVFHLNQKFFTKTEIKILERGLGFVLEPNLINEADL